MKTIKIFKGLMTALALIVSVIAVQAQETESSGDLYHGLTKKVTYDRMIPPYGLEVSYDKTTCAHKGV